MTIELPFDAIAGFDPYTAMEHATPLPLEVTFYGHTITRTVKVVYVQSADDRWTLHVDDIDTHVIP